VASPNTIKISRQGASTFYDCDLAPIAAPGQPTASRLIGGPVRDAASFILLHVLDEDEHKQVRACVWRKLPAWEPIHPQVSRRKSRHDGRPSCGGSKPTRAGAVFAAGGQLWSWRASVTPERLNRNREGRQPTSAERNLPEISSRRSSATPEAFLEPPYWPKKLN
jgi:hypothetical protein